METAAAAMLEAGVGRFSRAPALLAEMWAPLAVALAALATLPSLLRRLQVIVLRLRSRGKEVIQSHISTYYSSGDDESDSDGEEDDDEEDSSDEAGNSSSGEEEESAINRIGFYEGADGVFPWGGAVVRTWQGLPRRFSGCGGAARFAAPSGGGVPAVRLWGASTASGEPWWNADEGGRGGIGISGCRCGGRRVAARSPRPPHELKRNGTETGKVGVGDVNMPWGQTAGDADSRLGPTCQWE